MTQRIRLEEQSISVRDSAASHLCLQASKMGFLAAWVCDIGCRQPHVSQDSWWRLDTLRNATEVGRHARCLAHLAVRKQLLRASAINRRRPASIATEAASVRCCCLSWSLLRGGRVAYAAYAFLWDSWQLGSAT